MDRTDKAFLTLLAGVTLVTLSVRAQSVQDAPADPEEVPVTAEEIVWRRPSSATPVVLPWDGVERITTFDRDISSSQSRIPHTRIGRTEPPVIERELPTEPTEEEMLEDEMPYIFVDPPVPDPDVNPWGTTDQETFDSVVDILDEREAAAFRSLWITASPEERQELLMRARLGMMGG